MKITLTETGLLALVSLLIGFAIQFCRTAEQSRCRKILFCWGAVECNRDPLSSEAVLELNNLGEVKEEHP